MGGIAGFGGRLGLLGDERERVNDILYISCLCEIGL